MRNTALSTHYYRFFPAGSNITGPHKNAIFCSMVKSEKKYLVGLVGPEALSAIEADGMHPVFLDIEACNALEIRYDFFDEKVWPELSARVRKVAPHAMQIGTVRLVRDGGKFPDKDAYSRIPLWSKILGESEVPEWLDLEQDCLYDFKNLKSIADLRKTRILVSQHNFLRIPNQQELEDFARDCLRATAIPTASVCTNSHASTRTNSSFSPPSGWAKPERQAASGRSKKARTSRTPPSGMRRPPAR